MALINRVGLSVFDLIRYHRHDHAAVLCAFDLVELDGEDLRGMPLEHREGILADLLRVSAMALLSTGTIRGMARLSSSTPARSAATYRRHHRRRGVRLDDPARPLMTH
jgi:ATP-dependent DNA ligase